MSEPHGVDKARTRWVAVAALCLASIAAAFQIGKAPAALPDIRAELGLSLEDGVWIVSIFNLLGLSLGMVAGALADRLGHRRLIVFGFLCLAVASFWGAAADSFTVLLAGRVLEGLGFIVVVSAAPALLIAYSARRHHRLVFGFYSGYWPAGVAVMVLITPLVMDHAGWRGLWNLNGALMLLVLAVVFAATRAAPRAGPQTGPAREGPSFVLALRTFLHAGPVTLALTFGFYSSIHIAVVALLPTFYTEAGGLDLAAASALTALVAVVNVGGNIAAGIAMHRGVPRTHLVVGTFVLMAVSAFLIYDDGQSFAVRLGAAVFLSFIAGAIPASLFSATSVFAPAPNLVGATTGLMMQGSQLGQLLGPVAMAWVVATTGSWNFAPVTLISAAVAGIALTILLHALERRAASGSGHFTASRRLL